MTILRNATGCILILLCLLGVGPAAQVDVGWRSWLHDTHGEIVVIHEDGTVADVYTLPRPDHLPEVFLPQVSADGRLIAYIAWDAPSSEEYRRYIYDSVTAEAIEVQRALDVSCVCGPVAFDPPGRALAFAGVSGDDWALHIAHTGTGASLAHLDANSPNLPDLIVEADRIIPKPHRYDGRRVWFTAQFDYTSSQRTGIIAAAYVWDTQTGSVTPSLAYPEGPYAEFGPTGETANVVMAGAGDAITWTVEVYDPLLSARFPFYSSPVITPGPGNMPVTFVQNGRRLLLRTGVWTDDTYRDGWLLIERDGSVNRPLRHIERRDIHGTADGFIYTLTNERTSSTELVDFHVDVPLSDRVVWAAPGEWTLMHVDPGTTTYGPFRAWTHIGPVEYDVTPAPASATATPLPQPQPVLRPGMTALVQTGGDVLFLRDAAGTDGEILRYLYDGDIVTLVDGPVQNGAFRWWRIRTEDGVEGWAAAASGDLSTLLPDVPRTATPTPQVTFAPQVTFTPTP